MFHHQHVQKPLGSVLTDWLKGFESQFLEDLLNLVTNIAKFNWALLEDTDKPELIHNICLICDSAQSIAIVGTCLTLFDVMVRYGSIPPESLLTLISTLCRTVNIQRFSPLSWQTMANILRSHYGHQGIKVIRDPPSLFIFIRHCVPS